MKLMVERDILSFASFIRIAAGKRARRVVIEAWHKAGIPRRGETGGVDAAAQAISAGGALPDHRAGAGDRPVTRQIAEEVRLARGGPAIVAGRDVSRGRHQREASIINAVLPFV